MLYSLAFRLQGHNTSRNPTSWLGLERVNPIVVYADTPTPPMTNSVT